MFDLIGRKAFVTGASGDIGEAIARLLHAQGATVGIHGTREGKLHDLAASLKERVMVFPADLSNAEAVKALAAEVDDKMEGVDILVNNAGITRDGLLVRMTDQDWRDVLDVNLSAAFLLCRSLLAGMMKRRFGRIINISSVVGVVGNPGQSNYCAAKAGLIGFSKALAQEVATRNITVNCIAPGFIESAMTAKLNEKQKQSILSMIPMKKMGHGIDIAAAALYLSSDASSYVTGQTLHVNGGMAMI